MKGARLGWLNVRKLQFPEAGDELVDIPIQDQTVTFKEPEGDTRKQYVRVIVTPILE